MPIIDENVFNAFRESLRKEAGFADLVARAAPRLKNIGTGGGVGATLGGLGGGAIGAVHDYRKARHEGAGVGEAALGGLGGALRGAGKGALTGALAGGLAGGAFSGRTAESDLSALTHLGGPVGAGARFGQRQVHSVTGMLSPQELEGIRGGAFDARLALAKKPGAAGAIKHLAATEAATGIGPGSMNLTSIPGSIQAAREHGVGKVLSTGFRQQLASQPSALTALMVGMPALGAGTALLGKQEVDERGRGRGERAGEEVGRAVGSVAGGVMPVVGQGIVGGALGSAGKYVGRGVDRIRGKKPTPGLSQPGMSARTLEPTESQNTPSERVMSPSAAGQRPEIGI